jgi:hypothetical protein
MLGVYRKLGETTLRQDRSSLVGKGLPILDSIVSSANSTPSYKMVASRPDGTDGTVWACRKTKMFCRKLQSMARVLKLRIVVEGPPIGVDYALDFCHGFSGLMQTRTSFVCSQNGERIEFLRRTGVTIQ